MKKIIVSLGERSYPVLVGAGVIRSAGACIRSVANAEHVFVISNPTVWKLNSTPLCKSLRAARLSWSVILVADSERSKSLKEITRIIGLIAASNMTRRIAIAGFGGGVVGDIAGFAFPPLQGILRGIDGPEGNSQIWDAVFARAVRHHQLYRLVARILRRLRYQPSHQC